MEWNLRELDIQTGERKGQVDKSRGGLAYCSCT